MLAIFALLQIHRDSKRHREVVEGAKLEALGHAWAARRSLESSLKQALTTETPNFWAARVGSSSRLDPLERHFMRLLEVAGRSDQTTADAVKSAFEAFLAYADRVNELGSMDFQGQNQMGEPIPTGDDVAKSIRLASGACDRLSKAIAHLEVVAPRRDGEPHPPALREVKANLQNAALPHSIVSDLAQIRKR